MIVGDVEFFRELMEFYALHKRKIKKALRIKNDDQLVDFCTDFTKTTSLDEKRFIKNEYVCKLALIFSNIVGERLPDHLHARMILHFSGHACKEYVTYVNKLKPRTFFGFVNPNPNNFKKHALSVNGMLSRLASK